MTDWLDFETGIAPLPWGDKVYTIIRLPDEVTAALTAAGAKRVEAEIAEHPFNLAIVRAPVVEGAFLWAGQSLLSRIGAEPGSVVEVRLRPAPDDAVDTPDDIAAAVLSGGVAAAWDALTPGKRRGIIYRIGTARTAPTRAARIATLVRDLSTAP